MAENNPEDLYSDAEDNTATTPGSETTESDKAESTDEQTALLPKAIFMGKDLEPGKRCEIEIVHVRDGEVEVKYVPHGENKAESEDDMGMMQKSDSEMVSMME